MRTQDEIVARMEALKADDMLGFAREVLLVYLDFDHARPFIKSETTREQWDVASPPADRTDEGALKETREYSAFAWEKVSNHRGISASRNIDKMPAWAWLLGRDDLIDDAMAVGYAQYGAPQLRVLCEGLGFAMPNDEALARMAEGRPCRPGCEEGCGS